MFEDVWIFDLDEYSPIYRLIKMAAKVVFKIKAILKKTTKRKSQGKILDMMNFFCASYKAYSKDVIYDILIVERRYDPVCSKKVFSLL